MVVYFSIGFNLMFIKGTIDGFCFVFVFHFKNGKENDYAESFVKHSSFYQTCLIF